MSKSVQIPSSTQKSGAGTKNTARKKKRIHEFLHTQSIASENVTKVIFLKNKKNTLLMGTPKKCHE